MQQQQWRFIDNRFSHIAGISSKCIESSDIHHLWISIINNTHIFLSYDLHFITGHSIFDLTFKPLILCVVEVEKMQFKPLQFGIWLVNKQIFNSNENAASDSLCFSHTSKCEHLLLLLWLLRISFCYLEYLF